MSDCTLLKHCIGLEESGHVLQHGTQKVVINAPYQFFVIKSLVLLCRLLVAHLKHFGQKGINCGYPPKNCRVGREAFLYELVFFAESLVGSPLDEVLHELAVWLVAALEDTLFTFSQRAREGDLDLEVE